MEEKYRNWIARNYPEPIDALGKCKEATEAMAAAFPELVRTNGFIDIISDSDRMHWWLKDADGEIVDPTAHQFQCYNDTIIEYREIDDSHPARNFKQARCMECGEYYYVTPELKGVMHNKRCEASFSAYLNGQ